MPFSEKSSLLKDERRPLLRDPVWSYNHRYGRSNGYNPEEMEELLGIDQARNQKARLMIFLGVTFVSVLILFATMGILIKVSETHPRSIVTPTTDSTTPFPFKVSMTPSPSSAPPSSTVVTNTPSENPVISDNASNSSVPSNT